MSGKLSKKSILIIDDDSRMLGALDKTLTHAGANVTCQVWAGDIFKILTGPQKPFDLMITDLHMPFISGLTALERVHKLFPKLPIIVLTAFGSPDIEYACLHQGASAYLEKPLDASQLFEAIEKVLDSRNEKEPATRMQKIQGQKSGC